MTSLDVTRVDTSSGLEGKTGDAGVRFLLELVVAAACWGAGTVLVKFALDGLGAMAVLCLELLAATATVALLSGVRQVRRRRAGVRVTRPDGLARMVVAGLLEPGLANVGLTVGLTFASASDAAMLTGTESLFVMIMAAAWLGERPGRGALAGALVAASGVMCLNGSVPSASAGWGNLLVLGGACAAAGYSLVVSEVAPRTDTLTLTTVQFAAGGSLCLVLAGACRLVSHESWTSAATPSHVLAGLAAGILGTAVPFLLYNHAIEHVNVTSAAMVLNLIPLFGLIGATAVLGESLGRWQVLGGALILAGMTAFAVAAQPADLVPAGRHVYRRALPRLLPLSGGADRRPTRFPREGRHHDAHARIAVHSTHVTVHGVGTDSAHSADSAHNIHSTGGITAADGPHRPVPAATPRPGDTVPGGRPGRRRAALPGAVRGPAAGRGLLRGQGQPRPRGARPAHRAGV